MNFKPILFSTPMVQAIMEGRKTMTRRTVKGTALEWLAPDMFTPEFVADKENDLCPYGQVGDVLFVRETFQHTKILNINMEDESYGFVYKADMGGWENIEGWKWKPSLFMPKSACRIFLKITNIRVERLQDIKEDDAILEGIEIDTSHNSVVRHWKDYLNKNKAVTTAVGSFITLWKSINGEQSWNDNPFVWVISFEKIDKPTDFV